MVHRTVDRFGEGRGAVGNRDLETLSRGIAVCVAELHERRWLAGLAGSCFALAAVFLTAPVGVGVVDTHDRVALAKDVTGQVVVSVGD